MNVARVSKPVKYLDSNTKKMYLNKILKVKNQLGIDWIENYKLEKGKDVDLTDSDIESKMGLLEFIYDDKVIRASFNEDFKKLELNKTKKESSKTEIIKKNVINEIQSYANVMTKEELEEAIDLLTVKKNELIEKEEKEFYLKQFELLSIEEMKRLLGK